MNNSTSTINSEASVLTGSLFFPFVWSVAGYMSMTHMSISIMFSCLALLAIGMVVCFVSLKTNPFKALWHAFDNNFYLAGCILGTASLFLPLIFGKEVIPTLAIVADVIAVVSLVIGVINFALRGSK